MIQEERKGLDQNAGQGAPVMNRSKSSDQLSIGLEGDTNELKLKSESTQHKKFQMSAKMLTLGAGGDNQSHVIRPRTASNFNRTSQFLTKVKEGLDTITEK